MRAQESHTPSEFTHHESAPSPEYLEQYGKYEARLQKLADLIKLIEKNKNKVEFSTQNYTRRNQLYAQASLDFFEARADEERRTPEQFQTLKRIALEQLGAAEGKEWFTKTAEKEVVLRALSEIGYEVLPPSPDEMARYGVDGRIDLTNNEFDALEGFGGSVMLAVQRQLPYIEIPDNQIVFTDRNGSQERLLAPANLDFEQRNLAAQEEKKRRFLESYQRDNNKLWGNLELIADDDERLRFRDGDSRPTGIAVICLPDTTGEVYTGTTNFIDWETGEAMDYLKQVLASNFDDDGIMLPQPQRAAA